MTPPPTPTGAAPATVAAAAVCGIPAALMEPEPVGQIMAQLSDQPGTRLSRPLIAGWLMTHRCNLRCRHCWVDHRRPGCRASDRERIAHRLAEAGLCRVVLSGGEATLLPDFARCVRILKSTHTPISVYTNATALRRLDWLEHWDPAIDYAQVSIDGGGPGTFDAQRGPGVFRRFEAGLARLRAAGVRILAHYIATPWNNRPGDLRAAARLAASHGCETFVAELYHARGRAAGLRRDVAMDVAVGFQQEARLLLEDTELNRGPMTIHLVLPPVLPFPDWYKASVTARAGADVAVDPRDGGSLGTSLCFVMADGRMVPALEVADHPGLVYGSLLEHDLIDLWHRETADASLPRVRDLSRTPCNGCPDFPWCRGGSLKRVLEEGIGFHSPDPWCYRLQPEPGVERLSA